MVADERVESGPETRLLIPECREFRDAGLDSAVDACTEGMYREADVSKPEMARFLKLKIQSISDSELAHFQKFMQLALQQLIINGVIHNFSNKRGRVNKPAALEALRKKQIEIDPGTSAYHDIWHALMARLLSSGGGVETLRPRYQHHRGSTLLEIFFDPNKSTRENDLRNVEEDLATFFSKPADTIANIIKTCKQKIVLDDTQRFDAFLHSVFVRGTNTSYLRALKLPKVISLLERVYHAYPENLHAIFDEYKKLIVGLV